MPTDPEHHRKLERLYAFAPITRWYGATIRVDAGSAHVEIPIRSDFHHAAHAVHGSVYFRALDDAAFFAANSLVNDAFVLTVSFSIHFVRPVSTGVLHARGRVVHGGRRLFTAESHLFDDSGMLLGQGTGVFTKSAIALEPSVGYE
jgi:uncharacterized protein (TIGR00369 family)